MGEVDAKGLFSAVKEIGQTPSPRQCHQGSIWQKGKKKNNKKRKVMEKRDLNILRISAFAKLQKESVDNLGFQA